MCGLFYRVRGVYGLACGGVVVRLFRGNDVPDIGRLVVELERECSVFGAGALALFIGFVKGVVDGKRVMYLEYEAYESVAVEVLRRIGLSVLEKYDGVKSVHIYHRVGRAKPGELALAVLVVGVSRKEAMEALKEVVERVKHEPPIYKLEVREDGRFWVLGDGVRIAGKRVENG